MDNPVDQPVNRCQDRVMFQSHDLTRRQIVVPARHLSLAAIADAWAE